MTTHKTIIRSIAVLALFAWLATPGARAQNVHDGNQKGLPPFGTFHGSNFDMVSFQNGNLHIRIPIVSVPQRGGRAYTLTYTYNSPTWTAGKTIVDPVGTELWTVSQTNYDSAHWNMYGSTSWEVGYEIVDQQCTKSGVDPYTGYPWTLTMDYYVYRNFTVTDPTGAKHPFLLRYETDFSDQSFVCQNGQLPHGNLLKGVSTDGTGIVLDITNGPDQGGVTLKDGTMGWVVDSNGNAIDTLQRTLFTYSSGPGYPPDYEIWTIKDSNGNPQAYRIDFMTVNMQTNLCVAVPISPPNTCQEGAAGGPVRLPFKLTLPNQKFYQFAWAQNAHAELLRVDLPTGGYITYTHETRSYLVRHKPQHSGITDNTETYDLRREVSSRTVSDGQTSRTWTYTRLPGSPSPGPMVVRDPLGNEQVYSFIKIGESSYDRQTQHYQGLSASGTLLRTETKDYASELGPITYDDVFRPTINVRVIRETTILEDGKQSKVETDFETFAVSGFYTYTATRLNVSEKREYAYGAGQPGGLVRRTTFAYKHTGNQPYIDRNIVDRVTDTFVYDGAGNFVAKSQNEYDNYTEGIQASNAVAHNTAYGTSFTTRGNVTAYTRWRNTDGAWLTTRHQYDDAGSIVKTTDPLNHITTFDYTDAWANSACAPAGQGKAYLKQSTNHLGHRVQNTWNSCTGTLASTRDENDILASRAGTTYSYDFMDRLLETNLPDGGQTINEYSDDLRRVTSKVKKDGSSYVASRAFYDVLGRVWRQEQCEDGPTCAQVIRTDTTFDALGRKDTVTNPYRDTSESTYGITSFVYDALGRVTKVIPPDGTAGTNHGLTQYSGNVTTVTDQAGKQRRSTTDALGRLIQVDEPGGGGPAAPGAGSATVSGNLQGSGGLPAQATGWATVNGSLQSIPASSATAGTGSVNITGTEQSVTVQEYVGEECLEWIYYLEAPPECLQWQSIYQNVTYWDSGGVSITVNGSTKTVGFGYGSTGNSIATALANAINGDGGYPVNASVAGTVVYLTSKVTGAVSNYLLSAASWTDDPGHFVGPSFDPVRSGPTLTGGQNAAATTYDSGNAWVTVGGIQKTVSYGQGSTNTSVAIALRDAINNHAGYPVTAAVSGSTLNLTATTAGPNPTLSAGSNTTQGSFSQPSFTVSLSGGALTGGSTGSPYDAGTVTITVSGAPGGQFQAQVNFGQGSTASNVGDALRNALNAANSPVTAAGSGASITIAAKVAGANSNYSLSGSSSSSVYPSPSFSVTPSGLSGGVDFVPGTLATPAVTTYTYDTLDNLTSVLQSGSRQRTFTYNSLSQLTQAVNPESGVISYTYDNDGNLITKTSPKPNQTNPAVTVTATHTYDALHRLTQKSFNDGSTPTVTYFYDQTSYNGLTIGNGKGQRTGMSDASGTTAWSYDITVGIGWKTTERRTLNGVTKTIVSQNNLSGGLKDLTNPSGTVVTYGMDAAGRVTSATQGATSYASAATYAPSGGLASLVNGGAITSAYYYNNRLQPCRLHVRTSGSAPTSCGDTTTAVGNVLDFKYSFNAGVANNGNVTQIENKRDTNRTQNFTYDELNRIRTASTQATSGTHAWGLQFGYDIWANLLSASVTQGSAPALSVGADQNNRIAGYCYDAAGNLLIEASCGATLTYTYDAENRITTTGGVTYTYDGDGKRVKKSTGKLYWGELAESDLAGTISDEYVFFGGNRIARKSSSGTVFYYFADHLGTARVILQAGQTTPCLDADYYPFGGERTPVVNSCPQNYKFTGKERDAESGLDYFGARYYGSLSGRFTAVDPKRVTVRHLLNPQKLNKYAYVLNNPLKYLDPNGMEEVTLQWRAFIPAENQTAFKGDGRPFTTAKFASSRTTMTVRVETDPSKPINLTVVDGPRAGQTIRFDGKTDTASTGLPKASASRDANGNTVVNFQQDTPNPLTLAGTIHANVNVTIPPAADSVNVAGEVSRAPAFELNVGVDGKPTNVPVSHTTSNFYLFPLALLAPNEAVNVTSTVEKPAANEDKKKEKPKK